MRRLFSAFAFLFFTTFFTIPFQGLGQGNIKDSIIDMAVLGVGYGFQVPGGDLEERFGNNSNIGVKAQWKTASNLILGLEGGVIFGNTVRADSLLWGLRTSNGKIISSDGSPARVALLERGFTIDMTIGKVFPLGKPNPNSGIILKTGAGIMQHKIRIDVEDNNVPQLKGERKRGYDRLVSGLDLMGFAGYQYLSNQSLLNFYGGIEFHYGMTTTRRSYNIDEGGRIDKDRKDLLWGIRIGWTLPIYNKESTETYYH